ncbi:MAG: TonB-dependent receptor [Gemmatimonadota bacterium]
MHIAFRVLLRVTLLHAAVVGRALDVQAQDTTRTRSTDSTRTDSAARLQPVTVVATRAQRSEASSATHIDAAALRLTPANSSYDLLRQTAGLEVHQQGQGPGFASNASMRGFSSDHSTDLAVWVDGVPLNEPVNGHAEGYNDLAVLFPAATQDVDVIHGPTSALFGNFALAGIVNVRTLERLRGTQVTATGGSYGRADATILSGFDHGASGGGVVGARYAREDGFRPNAGYDIEQGHARIVHDVSPGVRIDAGVQLYGGNWKSAGFLGADEFAAHQYDIVSNPSDGGYKRRAQERVSLRVLTGNLLWRTTAYATQGRWQLFLTIPPAGGRFEGSGSQSEEEDSRAGVGATTALSWALPKGEVTLGAETRWDRSHYQNFFTTARTRDSVAEQVTGRQLSGAPFVQSHIDVNDRLRLDLGLRYDVLATRSSPVDEETATAAHGVLSPKVGALVHLTPVLATYGNVSRGFRSSDGVIGDPSLAPITATAYEVGLKADRGAFHASAALFRMDVSNEQTFNPVTLESSNGGSSRRQGVELDWRAPALVDLAVLSGQWTFNDARYTSLTAVPEDGDGPPETLNGLRVYNTSKFVGTVALDLARRSTPWRVRFSTNLMGPYSPFDQPGVVTGGYGLANTMVGWTRHALEVDVGVRNVFNRAYPELIAGEVVAPGEPRSLVVTVRTGG